MASYDLSAFFTAIKQGKTGLTITVDVYNSSGSLVVTDGSASTLGGGLYKYVYTTATDDDYWGIFKTSDSTVDMQHLPAMATKQVSSYIDAIKTKVDTNLDTTVSSRLPTSSYTVPPTASAISTEIWTATSRSLTDKLDFLLSATSVASIVDGVWDEALTGATHNVATSAGKRLRQLASNIIYSGEVVSSTENVIRLDTGAANTNGAYDPALIVIISGTGIGQSRNILEYEGSTRKATIDRDWKNTPSAGDEYMILANAGREHVNEGLARGGTTNTITLNTNASSYNNTYIGQVIFIRSGLGEDQACRVIAYDGTSKIVTVAKDWHVVPDATSAYVMLPTGILDIEMFIQKIWEYSSRTLTGFGTLVSDIWSNSTRTLTSFGTLVSDIWANSTRSLTTFGTLVSDVWGNSTRTLTSFGTLASDVWSNSTRSLTTFGTLVSDIWANSARSLTTFGTLVSDTASAVWVVSVRELSGFGTLVSDIWGNSTRSLTTFGTLVSDVWGYTTRELSGFGTLISDIWSNSTRTLTSFNTLISDIWANSTRTLTSFGTLPADVWTNSTRSLTTFGTLVSDIWSNSVRSLTVSTGATAQEVWEYVTRTLTSTGGLTAEQVWEYQTRTLTSLGTMATDLAISVWNYVKRTLTSENMELYVETVNELTCVRGDSFSYIFSDLLLDDVVKAYFTVKSQYKDLDSQSIIQISSTDNLLYLNGVESETGVGATLIININDGTAIINLLPVVTKELLYNTNKYVFDLEIIKSDDSVSTIETGTFDVTRDVTRSIV